MITIRNYRAALLGAAVAFSAASFVAPASAQNTPESSPAKLSPVVQVSAGANDVVVHVENCQPMLAAVVSVDANGTMLNDGRSVDVAGTDFTLNEPRGGSFVVAVTCAGTPATSLAVSDVFTKEPGIDPGKETVPGIVARMVVTPTPDAVKIHLENCNAVAAYIVPVVDSTLREDLTKKFDVSGSELILPETRSGMFVAGVDCQGTPNFQLAYSEVFYKTGLSGDESAAPKPAPTASASADERTGSESKPRTLPATGSADNGLLGAVALVSLVAGGGVLVARKKH